MQEFNRQIIAIFDNSHVSSETYPSPRVSRLTSYEVSLFFHGYMGIDRVEGFGVSEQQLFKRLFY